MEACVELDKMPYMVGATFNKGVLPSKVPESSAVSVVSFATYLLTPGLLVKRRQRDGHCRESWAFALTGALEHAVWLAYDRMGFLFENGHMSVEFLLSCYEQGPHGMCGCYGADLPTATQAVSQHGLVTFSQFPYVSSTSVNTIPYDALNTYYYCENQSHLGTCRPCDASLNDYVETTISASPDVGSYRVIVPCMPCSQPTAPKYHPKQPFHVAGDSTLSLQQKVNVVKAELLRLGPLCAALGADLEALSAMQSGGHAPRVPLLSDGVFYKPRHMYPDKYHCVLIVAFYDPGNVSTQEAGPSGRAFWVCRTFDGNDDFGYTFTSPNHTVDNLFNVGMYDVDSSWLLDRVVSFERVQVQTEARGPLHDLTSGDPFIRPKSPVPTPPTPPFQLTQGSHDPSHLSRSGRAPDPPKRTPRLFLLAFFLLTLAAALALFAFFEK